ncbi:hypothetical protein [Rugamonas aquatica]|uniref:Uncharacterized protein n=1 Tax=Rugamonas aquatica TaxID=2743357 RepID=A0A6A7N049_9BURK|nr:hypothetical protein [Rugamonas aquatica]MQA38399.1 hypothetical protein [Rugamonas aquatica]
MTMIQHRMISQSLVDLVVGTLIEQLPWAEGKLGFELQDDFQFLLITVPCDIGPELSQEERRQLGHQVDRMMPTRDGELTWMLNFTTRGKVVDSYFGGDSRSPAIGF